MRESRYRDFSLKTHKINWSLRKPNVCQFELTFGCGLHCKHCYTDCYNRRAYLKKELNKNKVKSILDKVHKAGIIWLCFTGGDPLTRPDFMDIYDYTKEKGFIIIVFTNGYSMTKQIAGYFKRKPPFVIEMTLNAVTEGLYEKISRVKGSFKKAMEGIDLILKQGLPLKIKTEITKDNLQEVPGIKKFIRGLGLKFRPNFALYARLNGDLAPCDLRIAPEDIVKLNGRIRPDCRKEANGINKDGNFLFRCAAGVDAVHIDPYGNTFLCDLIRSPSFNLLRTDAAEALNRLCRLAKNSKFTTDSECNNCNLREFCDWCPGKTCVETGDMQAPIKYYCELTRIRVNSNG